MPATKTRPKRAKQVHLPGMEPPRIEAIERLAEAYVQARTIRMEALEEEVKQRDLLFAQMRMHNLTRYEFDGSVVEMVTETKVKVRKKGEKSGERDGDE